MTMFRFPRRPRTPISRNREPARIGTQHFSRRRFLASTAAAGLGLVACRRSGPASRDDSALATLTPERRAVLESRLQALVTEHHVPGCAAAVILNARLAWSAGFGMADLDAGLPMTPDTLLNIGSVTKTVTATGVLQLVEQGRLDLDADVQTIVGFGVRNPRHPERPITIRQLLTHRSSVMDGAEYGESYVCGDQPRPLGEWLAEYFAGPNLDSHFHAWAPGELDPPPEPRAYSNVGYGLLGHVVERVSGLSYEDYCRDRIFRPLGMESSSFRIDRIDPGRHAVPYLRVPEESSSEARDLASRLGRYTLAQRPPEPGQMYPLCLYSFGTPPDGLLRTSVNQLSRFIAAWIDGGLGRDSAGRSSRVLRPETVDLALADSHFGRKLCWDPFDTPPGEEPFPGESLIYHGGGDPGIATFAGFRRRQRSGIVLFFNTSSPANGYMEGVRALVEACDPA